MKWTSTFKGHFLTSINLFHSRLIGLGPPCQTPAATGAVIYFYLSLERKVLTHSQHLFALSTIVFSGLANFVSLNVAFKIALPCDSLSWPVIKYNTLSEAGQKIILENKKAGKNGMNIYVILRKKLDRCVLSFNKCLCNRINDKLIKMC